MLIENVRGSFANYVYFFFFSFFLLDPRISRIHKCNVLVGEVCGRMVDGRGGWLMMAEMVDDDRTGGHDW